MPKTIDYVDTKGNKTTTSKTAYTSSYKPSAKGQEIISNNNAKQASNANIGNKMDYVSSYKPTTSSSVTGTGTTINYVPKVNPKPDVESVAEESKASVSTQAPQTFDYSALVSALAKMNTDKYSALRDALLANRQRADDLANMNYQRNLRQWKKTYNGNAGRLNGAGLSNKFNLMASRDSTIRNNEADYLNNLATVQSGRYDDASNLLRGLSNPDQNTINALLKYYM